MIFGQDVEKNLCHTLYKCKRDSVGNTIDEILDYIVDSEHRKKRSTRGLLFGRPFRKPPNSTKRRECQKCEQKRSSCTTVSTA